MKAHRDSSRLHKRKSFVWNQFDRVAVLFIGDTLLLNTALLLGLMRRGLFVWEWSHFEEHYYWYIVLTGLWFFVSLTMNVYEFNRVYSREVKKIIETALIAAGTAFFYLLIPRATPFFPERRIDAAIFPFLSFLFLFNWRWIFSQIFNRKKFNTRVLFVGAGKSATDLLQVLNLRTESGTGEQSGLGYEVLGFIDDDSAKQGTELHGIPVLAPSGELIDYVMKYQPDEIILAITHRQNLNPNLYHSLLKLNEKGWRIRTMAEVYQRMTGKIPIAHIGDVFEVLFSSSRPSYKRLYHLLIAIFHFFVGVFGSLVTIGMIPFVFAGNLLFSPGPLFYTQRRIGLSGEAYRIIKFRSMVTNAEKDTGPVWSTASDSRITPFGRFLRKSRLDEFPQFFNILKGDMALIGPRPERPEFVRDLEHKIPFYNLRHGIKPGITGWAQVNYTYGSSEEDTFQKMQYDLYYVINQGIVLDLSIAFKTILVILRFRGR
jgi:exopolysaccharide biosynthesis polyprenyl glycosylphosphotransferase